MIEIKDFVGKGIDGLSFEADGKGVFCILCADEAQRHELSCVMCGCSDANGGTVTLDGEVMSRRSLSLKKKVRLVPSQLVADEYCNSVEYLDFVGQTLDIESEKRYRQIKEALELVGMDGAQSKLLGACSSSELCRLSIAAALIGNPDVIVLDDPFSIIGDDARKDMYGIINMLSGIKTIVLITGSVEDARSLCESVAIVSGGKIAIEGRIDDIETKINATHEVYITVRGDAERVTNAIKAVDCVVDVRINSTEANGVHYIRVEHYPDDGMKDKLFEALSAINAPMLSVKEVRLTLEDVYYSLTPRVDETATNAEAVEDVRKNRSWRRKNK